ncbi:MAG: hypothetical protein WAU65_01955 [Candidatus Nanoarchaeia archaeon]
MKKGEIAILNLEIPEEIVSEIVILYNLGVNMEDLKYILELRLNGF